jgi:hypothetical protein
MSHVLLPTNNIFPGRAGHPTERDTPHRISTRLDPEDIQINHAIKTASYLSKLVEQEGRL